MKYYHAIIQIEQLIDYENWSTNYLLKFDYLGKF